MKKFILLLGMFIFLKNICAQDYYTGLINQTYFHLNRASFTKAIKTSNAAIEEKPDSGRAYYLKGLAEHYLLMYTEAELDFDKAIKTNFFYEDVYKFKALNLISLNKYSEAIEVYSSAIGKDSTDASLYDNRASIYNKLRKYEIAIQDCNKANKLNPHFADAYATKGDANFYLGRYSEALEAYLSALKLRPAHLAANTGVIKTFNALDDSVNACKYYYKAYLMGLDQIKDSVPMICSEKFNYKSNNKKNSREYIYFKDLALLKRLLPNSTYSKTILKWTTDIRISVKGQYRERDLKSIRDFIEEINPLIYPIKISIDTINPNVIMQFIPEYDFAYYHKGYITGALGITSPDFNYNFEITSATISVSNFILRKKRRNEIIRHELSHLLGIPNHSPKFRSPLHAFATKSDFLELDKFSIKLLYSDKIYPGDNEADIDVKFCDLKVED